MTTALGSERRVSVFGRIPLEAIFWLAGLAYLAFVVSPEAGGHFDFCLFSRLGVSFCPGCGLGQSVAYLFDGELARSWQTHPLGLFALVVLSGRIISLLKPKAGNVNAAGYRHYT